MVPYILLSLIYIANGQEFDADCITPTGLASHCISIEKCEKLKPLIRLPAIERETLKAWHCGYDDDIPRVCCPPTTVKNRCNTIMGKPGVCVSIKACPNLNERLKPPVSKENLELIMRLKCKGPEEFNVCCDEPVRKPITGTIKEPDNRIRDGTTLAPITILSVTSENSSTDKVTANPLTLNNGGNGDTSNINDLGDCNSAEIPDLDSGCCGIESASGNKIIGGTAAAIDQFPWLALLEYSNERWICGGALISKRWVLTAAHCLVGNEMRSRNAESVRLGDYNITNPGVDCVQVEGGGIDCIKDPISIKINRTILHPEYRALTTVAESNDIGLLRLENLAPYNDFIRPICLPVADILKSPPPNIRFFVAGWGAVNETRPTSEVKNFVDLPLYEETNCNRLYSVRGKSILWEKQMCVGGEDGKDSCQGDSGGPLMYAEDEKTFQVIGITSFGVKQCGSKGRPSIYTKVYLYLDWIRNQTQS